MLLPGRSKKNASTITGRTRPTAPLPTRADQLASLRTEQFDVLVIGGGATGSGCALDRFELLRQKFCQHLHCALDSATRGLKTAMVELDDFSSGTSSRSTKLIHGGVRYLQKAIMGLDYEQYKMVKEALHERANLLDIAPHLSFPLPIMLPVYRWWQLPYFWAGIKAYDLVSGADCLEASYVLTKGRALEQFPMLKKNKLCGAIVYYDGMHNDARMNISIAISAARLGATIANHTRVLSLLKDGSGKVSGARCRYSRNILYPPCCLLPCTHSVAITYIYPLRDELTGEEFEVKAKSVINATGPFTDSIRKMDDGQTRDIVCPSAGIHIMLPDYYSPGTWDSSLILIVLF